MNSVLNQIAIEKGIQMFLWVMTNEGNIGFKSTRVEILHLFTFLLIKST